MKHTTAFRHYEKALIRVSVVTVLPLLLSVSPWTTVRAANYTCDGGSNPVPTSVGESVEITADGDCTISHGVAGVGHIHIKSKGGKIKVKGLTVSSGDIVLTSEDDKDAFVKDPKDGK